MLKKYHPHCFMLILLGITAVLITVSGILFSQSPLRMLPLYVSLIVGLLQSRVNRLAPLIGGINALLYAAVYVWYGLYASALYAVLVCSPLQIVTFLRWKTRPYGQSVIFRKMTGKQRIGAAAAFGVCFGVLWAAMSALGSSYRLLDNTVTLFGILISVLTIFPYIEYTWLMIVNGVFSIGLYFSMIGEYPEQLTFLFYSIYSMICCVRAFFHARRLYREQQEN